MWRPDGRNVCPSCALVRKRFWLPSNAHARSSPFRSWGLIPITVERRINEALMAYCEQEHITFTRGRPHLKNDQCFVEQKNGAIVRQVVGYDRLVEEHAYRQLTELYRALRLYVNCFQPSMKLLSKQRE